MSERLALARLEARLTGTAPAEIVIGGRYVVRAVLGKGGMGEVVRAFDRALDRDVALKCLRADLTDVWSAAQCIAEARALAQVSHDNVVTVFDVVADGDRVFVVMELVRGTSLRSWLAADRRAWPEIVGHMIAAARGLAAVHAAGLVHGDVKPDNILVGGRARVVDFGLARGQELASTDTDGEHSDARTQRSSVYGTFGYLAPEQYEGALSDAATDQAAFCITLFEALYGMRAFDDETLERLRSDPGAWTLRERPSATEVPAAIHAVILRGAARERSRRFHDMDALVEALQDACGRRSPARRVLACIAVGTLAWLAAGAHAESHPRTLAGAGVSRMPTHEQLALRRGLVDAVEIASEAVDLADYAAAESELVHAYFAAREIDDAAAALDAALEMVTLLGHRLARRSDAELWCRHARAVLDPHRPLDAARVAIAEADLLLLEARHAEAIAGLGAAVDVLDTASPMDLATAAAARNDLGMALAAAGDHDGAIAQYERALALSRLLYGHDDLELAGVLANLGNALSSVGRDDEAVRAHTRALQIRESVLASEHPDIAASLTSLGSLLARGGRKGEARDHFLRALAIQERTLGVDHPSVAVTLNNLANLDDPTADAETVVGWYARALAIQERARGSDHPDVAVVASNLAVALFDLGRSDEAVALLERSLAIRERVFGPDHEETAYALHNLGVVAHCAGRREAAIARLEAALRIREKGGDPRLLESTRLALAEARAITPGRAR